MESDQDDDDTAEGPMSNETYDRISRNWELRSLLISRMGKLIYCLVYLVYNQLEVLLFS